MEVDSLTTIHPTAQLDSAYRDTTAIMLQDWQYYNDLEPLMKSKIWLEDTIQLFHQRNAIFFNRHDGVFRADKVMSESMLLMILLLETLLVAYLIKNGIKLLNNSIKSVFVSDGRTDLSDDILQKGSHFRQYLWFVSVAIFALFCPMLLNIGTQRSVYEIDTWFFLRLLVYVVLYFTTKFALTRFLGYIFFKSAQTKRFVMASKTTLSFYAICLTPILISSEIGIHLGSTFLLFWILGFLVITKIWLLVKVVHIFSVKIGGFLYLILYLCALEIIPILLFYKGLFLL